MKKPEDQHIPRYRCDRCKLDFSDKDDFQFHAMSHAGEDNYRILAWIGGELRFRNIYNIMSFREVGIDEALVIYNNIHSKIEEDIKSKR